MCRVPRRLSDSELARTQLLCNFRSKHTAPLVGYARDASSTILLYSWSSRYLLSEHDLNGVDVSRFQHFVIMNLKPLSEEQQREAIKHQLKDAKQFEHLAAFKEIRLEHDRIFTQVAFPDEKERREIENFEQQNRFFASA